MYQLVAAGTYPGTDLPVFDLYDAEEYADVTRSPRPVGQVWAVGVRGVTGRHVPTGVRFQATGSWDESPLFPAGAYAAAATALVAAL